MSHTRLVFAVVGDPAPQGSKDTFYNPKTNRTVVKEASARVKPWRENVVKAAVPAQRAAGWVTLNEPVFVTITFRIPRPKKHYGTGRNAHVLNSKATAKPTEHNLGDVDKLQRSTFDALTTAGVIADDKLITTVAARKVWAEHGGAPAGATIIVRPDVDEQEAAA